MTQAGQPSGDFAYGSPASGRAGTLAVSILADHPQVRADLRADAEDAGFHIAGMATLAEAAEGDLPPLGEILLVDCPGTSGTALAALSRLDLVAQAAGRNLVVTTTMAALDDVFACADQSDPHVLVDAGSGDRLLALAQVGARAGSGGVRELSDGDRLALLRLTEQVGQIAARLDRLSAPFTPAGPEGAFRFSPPVGAANDVRSGGADCGTIGLVRDERAALPDPRLVRRIIRQRQARARFFDGELFADPAWDMLLDLTAARAEQQRVSVTSLCIASGVPPTTALRWIGQMVEASLFRRVEDAQDRRRAFIALTDIAADGMARFFAEINTTALVV
ncbi:MAG: MarR family transcriptional regulator [Novosphingobium sp.]